MNLAILASTSGTDLQAIIEEMQAGKMPGINLVCVISNKQDCGALEKARKAEIEAIFLDSSGLEREAFDRQVSAELEKRQVDLIALIGYMRFLSPWFVEKYRNRIMNVHPSLLPSFAGMDRSVHEDILNYGCKVSGATIHFVDEGADTGPIILQEAVNIAENETVDSLRAKVQALEKKMYPEAIRLFTAGKLKILGNRRVQILP